MAEITNHDFVWEQGEDHLVTINYKQTEPEYSIMPDTHEVRMDIAPLVAGRQGEPVWSFNSSDFEGSLDTEGEYDNEGEIPSVNEIKIRIPHTMSLEKTIVEGLKQTPPVKTYVYDVFVRDVSVSPTIQWKILKGKITINRSVTHWL